MDTIIFIVILIASIVYNMIQYKQIQSCGCTKQISKPSKYKQSWKDGGKAKKNWK